MSRQNLLPLLLFPVILIALIIVPLLFGTQLAALFSSAAGMRAWVEQQGAWGPLAFIAAQVLQVVFFVIPGHVVQIAAGYLFGTLLGALYSCIGIAIGTVISYGIGYRFGALFMQRIMKPKSYALLAAAAHSPHTLLVMFFIFLIPGLPKDLVVLCGGTMRMPFALFVVVTMAARVPALIGTTAIGASLFAERWVAALVITAVVLLLLAVGVLLRTPIWNYLSRLTNRR